MASPRVRPPVLLGTAVAVALVAASWSVPTPALAALPPQGFVTVPLANTYGDTFTPSATGNPVTDSGLVAGTVELGRYAHAAVFDLNRRSLTVLGTLGGRESYGADVNASGDVVGRSELTYRGEVHAFLWTARTGVMHDLGTYGGRGDHSEAEAVNDAGVVVGWGNQERPGTTPRAMVWDTAVSPVRTRVLPLPAGARTAVAHAVNNRGQVVGRATGDTDEGFLYDPATATLGPLGSVAGGRVADAADINEQGYVVGRAEIPRTGPSGPYTAQRSYRWSPVTRTATLMVTTPGAAGYDEVRAINRYGLIVGLSRRDRATQLAVWNACGTPVHLQPAPDGVSSAAYGVNRDGRIVGYSSASRVAGAEFVRAGPCVATP